MSKFDEKMAIYKAAVKELGLKISDDLLTKVAKGLGQHLKKQAVQVVIVFDFVKVKKRIRFVAFVVSNKLGFQQLQKQYSVYPSNGKFKGNIEKPFLICASKLVWFVKSA
jgi:hypothetical protein